MGNTQGTMWEEEIKFDQTADIRAQVLPVLYSLGPKARVDRIDSIPKEKAVYVRILYDGETVVFRFGDVGLNFSGWVEIFLSKQWADMPADFLAKHKQAAEREGLEIVSYDHLLCVRMDLNRLGSAREVESVLRHLTKTREEILSSFETARQSNLPPGVLKDRRRKIVPALMNYDKPNGETIQ